MKRAELERMTVDELWTLHVEVSQLLQQKIQQEKLRMDERLRQLASASRSYPPINTGIPISHQRPGQVEASNRGGWSRS